MSKSTIGMVVTVAVVFGAIYAYHYDMLPGAKGPKKGA